MKKTVKQTVKRGAKKVERQEAKKGARNFHKNIVQALQNSCRVCAALACVLVVLSCDLFYSSPFPEYLGNIQNEINYSAIISEQFTGEITRTSFQLFSAVLPNSQQSSNALHVFLLVSPTFDGTSSTTAQETRPFLLHFNETGTLQRVISLPENPTASAEDSAANFNMPELTLRNNFAAPLLLANNSGGTAFTNDDLLISGTVSIDLVEDNFSVYGAFNHPFRSSFGLSIKGNTPAASLACTSNEAIPGTYIFNTELSISEGFYTVEAVAFDNSRPEQRNNDWSRVVRQATATDTSTTCSNADSASVSINVAAVSDHGNLVLRQILANHEDQHATFIFEDTQRSRLQLWRVSYADVHNFYQEREEQLMSDTSTTPTTPPNIALRSSQSTTINIANSQAVFYTDSNVIVQQMNGRMLRYTLDSSNVVDSIQAEARQGVLLHFSSNSRFLYRFDPELLRLQVLRTWW